MPRRVRTALVPKPLRLLPRQVVGDIAALLSLLREGPQDRRVLAMRMGGIEDRRMRNAVDHARRRGELVIYLEGMYRLAASRDEFSEWAKREQQSRLRTLHQQLSAMSETAARLWPEQLRIAI